MDMTFSELLNQHLYRRDRSAAWLAERLQMSRSTASRWVKGENYPRAPQTVERIADVLSVFGDERNKLLAAYLRTQGIRVGKSTSQPRAQDDVDGRIPAKVMETPPLEPVLASDDASGQERLAVYEVPQNRTFLLFRAWTDWAINFFNWEEAPADWEGKVIHTLRVVMDRITPPTLLLWLLALLFWVISAWLMGPFLQWPLNTLQDRILACLQFAGATVALPLLIGLIIKPLPFLEPERTLSPAERRVSLLLKLAGAYVGYNALAGTLFFVTFGWYHVSGAPLPMGIISLFICLPLLFAYVTARRIPLERYRMFSGTLRMHDADPLFLVTMAVFGPLLAAFVYLFYPYLILPEFGVTTLIVLVGWAGWQQWRQQRRKPTPD